MIAVVHRLIIGLHHYIDDGPSKAKSSVPRDTNSQVKRSRQPAWRTPCPAPWGLTGAASLLRQVCAKLRQVLAQRGVGGRLGPVELSGL